MNILTVTNAATDGWFHPRAAEVDQSAAVTSTYSLISVNDMVKATITGANDDDGVTVTVRWEDGE
jgi:hypothetical protein